MNRNLSYKNIFGQEYTHLESLRDKIVNGVIHIEMDENHISEKSFRELDQLRDRIESIITDKIIEDADQLFQSGKRIRYISEKIWDETLNKIPQGISENLVEKFHQYNKI